MNEFEKMSIETREALKSLHKLFPANPPPEDSPWGFLEGLRLEILDLQVQIKSLEEKLEQESREGDGWQAKAKEWFENGNCPVCFASDEEGHKEGCEWGDGDKEYNKALDEKMVELAGLRRTNEGLRTLAKARLASLKDSEEELEVSRANENTWKDKYLELQIILVERDQKIAWLREQVQNLLRYEPEPRVPVFKYKASGERYRVSSSAPNPFLSRKALDHLVKQLVDHKLVIKHLVDHLEEDHGKTVLFSARTLNSIEEAKKLIEAP